DSSSSLPKPAEATLSPVWRVNYDAAAPQKPEPSQVSKAADALRNAELPEARNAIPPAKALADLDQAAGRFVHTLLDSKTQEVLLRYPNEGRLAFSRAVSAYERALARE